MTMEPAAMSSTSTSATGLQSSLWRRVLTAETDVVAERPMRVNVPGSPAGQRRSPGEAADARALGAGPPLAGDALEHVGVDVEVRVHRVDVVEVLQRLDQAHQLRRAVLVELDARLR